jgi:hypothetical protein
MKRRFAERFARVWSVNMADRVTQNEPKPLLPDEMPDWAKESQQRILKAARRRLFLAGKLKPGTLTDAERFEDLARQRSRLLKAREQALPSPTATEPTEPAIPSEKRKA